MNTIDNELKLIICKILGQSTDIDINDDTDLINDLNFDSLKMIQLVVELEEKYNFHFSDKLLNRETLSNYYEIKKIIEKEGKVK